MKKSLLHVSLLRGFTVLSLNCLQWWVAYEEMQSTQQMVEAYDNVQIILAVSSLAGLAVKLLPLAIIKPVSTPRRIKLISKPISLGQEASTGPGAFPGVPQVIRLCGLEAVSGWAHGWAPTSGWVG